MCDVLSTVYEYHSPYMACEQSANWVLSGMMRKEPSGFIVQEVEYSKEIDGIVEEGQLYYEAWTVINNVIQDKNGLPDDSFVIGGCFDTDQALRNSLYHSGKISFYTKVYWVDESDPASIDIRQWNHDVHMAGNLKSTVYSESSSKLFKNRMYYNRSPFIHEWNLTSVENCKRVVWEYCSKKYPEKHEEELRRGCMESLLKGVPQKDDTL